MSNLSEDRTMQLALAKIAELMLATGRTRIEAVYGIGDDYNEPGDTSYFQVVIKQVSKEVADREGQRKDNEITGDTVYRLRDGKDVTDEWDANGRPGELKGKKKWGL